MNVGLMFRRLNSLRNRSITVRAAVLTVTVLAVYLPAAAAVGLSAGPAGVVDCSAAAFACFLGAAIALFISHFIRGPIPALSGAMLGMSARMAVPLALATAYMLASSRPDPAPLYWLLIFYPVTLTAEIMLSIPLDGACRPVQQQPGRRAGETWT